jgi:hypothetical protein
MQLKLAPLALALLAAAPSTAQSLSPMRREVVSFEARFALRLMAGNPSGRAQTIAVRVFDLDWNELDDVWVSRPEADVAAGGRVDVIVIAPFHGETERELRVCAESAPKPFLGAGAGAQIRGQVCGRYRARRVS